MATVAEAFVTIRPDMNRFGPELQRSLSGPVAQVERTMARATGASSKFGSSLGGAAKAVGVLAVAMVALNATSALQGFFNNSIKAASDLGESVNAVNQIFGRASQAVLDWGKNNATSFGLSQRAFNQLATPLGAILRNLGFDQDAVAESTIELTKRAADMASVFNTDVSQALEAITGAIRGEAEPIERFGVSVNQTAVNLRALGQTGKKSAEDLSEQEKAAARLAIIFEQTEAVAGDFADTSGQLANKTRILKAEQEQLSATLGQKLLPVQLKITQAKLALVNVIATRLIPSLEALYAKHWPAVAKVIESVRPILETMKNEWEAKIGALIQSFSSFVKYFAAGVELFSDIVHGRWGEIWGDVQDVATHFAEMMINNVSAAFGTLPNIMISAVEAGINGVIGLLNKIPEIKVPDFVPEIGGNTLFGGLNLGSISLPRLPTEFFDISKGIKGLGSSSADARPGVDGLGKAATGLGAAAEKASQTVYEALNQIRGAASALFGQPTREEAQNELRQAQLSKTLASLPEGSGQVETLRKHIEAQLDAARKSGESMQANNRIQQLRLTLADKSLSTEKQQNSAFEKLLVVTENLTAPIRAAGNALGITLIEGVDKVLSANLFLENVIRNDLVPAKKAEIDAAYKLRDGVDAFWDKINGLINPAAGTPLPDSGFTTAGPPERPTISEIVNHIHVHLDGEEIYTAVVRRMPGDANAFAGIT